MDIHMPVMDGLEAAAKILELNTNIPIIAMTANIMHSDHQIYMDKGMNDCVGKPFTSHELWHCLMKFLNPISWQSVNGNGKRYTQAEDELRYRLIKDFVKDNQKRFSEIETAINTGDIKLAHRLAHSLKSNAGQLGKTLLQQAAANMENHLKDGKNLTTKEQLKTLETELNSALEQLTVELETEPITPTNDWKNQTENTSEKIDAQSIHKLFEEVEPMLKMGNPECMEFIDNLRQIPESGKLIQQMENFNFEHAIATLAELKKNLKIE
jgi:CheY-like chemotaxis protein